MDRLKSVLRYIKNIAGYVFCIGVACLMAVMIDGRGGVMIAAILILAYVFSQLIMLFERRKISAQVICSHKMIAKGDTLTVQIRLKKSTILPTPFIEVELGSSPQLHADEKLIYKLALTSLRNYEEIKISFTAVYSGLSSVCIKDMRLVDFLGITSYKILDQSQEEKIYKVKILPNIPDTGAQPEILKTTSENSGFDDSEEETSESAVGATGTPGYEHRAYSPGDPLKKINWKLSSKRNIFMVRMDEKLSVSSQVFVLDCPEFPVMSDLDHKNLDIVIEGCLAMLAMLVRQGLESEIYYYIGEWRHICVRSMKDVIELQEELSGFSPVTPQSRLPEEAQSKGGIVCFSCVDMAHLSMAQDIFETGAMVIVSENSGFLPGSHQNMWICTSEFEFKKLV